MVRWPNGTITISQTYKSVTKRSRRGDCEFCYLDTKPADYHRWHCAEHMYSCHGDGEKCLFQTQIEHSGNLYCWNHTPCATEGCNATANHKVPLCEIHFRLKCVVANCRQEGQIQIAQGLVCKLSTMRLSRLRRAGPVCRRRQVLSLKAQNLTRSRLQCDLAGIPLLPGPSLLRPRLHKLRGVS